eukprot:CFRG4537T1
MAPRRATKALRAARLAKKQHGILNATAENIPSVLDVEPNHCTMASPLNAKTNTLRSDDTKKDELKLNVDVKKNSLTLKNDVETCIVTQETTIQTSCSTTELTNTASLIKRVERLEAALAKQQKFFAQQWEEQRVDVEKKFGAMQSWNDVLAQQIHAFSTSRRFHGHKKAAKGWQ